MDSQQQFRNSDYGAEMAAAERELSAFIGAVSQLFGAEEAKLSAEDWLDELESMDSPPQSTNRDWRSVTIAASARLATRIPDGQHRKPNHGVRARLRQFFMRGVRGAAGSMNLL